MSDAYWRQPLRWNTAAALAGERRRVFCSSMADVFEVHPDLDAPRQQLWALIEQTPHLDWLLLTKRPEQIGRMLPGDWLTSPRPNVWLGTSVEDQAAADLRVPRLLSVPAAVHWLSCEPLLGPVDVMRWLCPVECCPACDHPKVMGHIRKPGDEAYLDWPHCGNRHCCAYRSPQASARFRRVRWIVAGGESGPAYRPMDLDWARWLQRQCEATSAAFFFKQSADRFPGRGVELDGQTWHEFPAVRPAVTS